MAKKLLFTLLVVLGLLGGAELVLRVLLPDIEQVVSPLVYQRNSGQAFTAAKAPGTRRYVAGRGRTVTNKKAGTRILVFGASAAYGEMFSPLTAFPGQAEARLRKANPEHPIEVLNLAHGGMGSRQVSEMVFRALENDNPDLIVVYTGNNEYHELRALKARSDRYDPGAELMRRRLSKSYLYRSLRDALMPAEDTLAPPDDGTWLPIGRLDVTVDTDDRALGVVLYREHLRNLVLAAQARGIPVLLTTVATNARDHLDNATPGDADATERDALRSLESTVDKVSADQFVEDARAKEGAIKTEGGWHRLGNLLLRAGRPEAAAEAFAQKELAALRPMTSNRDLRQVVRTLGRETGTPVCDLSALLAAQAENGISGQGQFIDHCHPNAAGHRILGEALAECITEMSLTALQGGSTLDAKTTPFRVDTYTGHREIPGFKTNPKRPDTRTAEGAALAGHQEFVRERYAKAITHYESALEQGGDPAGLHHAMGLAAMYADDLSRARRELKLAAASGNAEATAALLPLSP